MLKRTTIEIDQDLLRQAKRALGETTTRGTVEAALRHAIHGIESEQAERALRQRRYFEAFGTRADLGVLASEDMWL